MRSLLARFALTGSMPEGRLRSLSGEICAQGDDGDTSVPAERQHRTVPGDDNLHTAPNRVFEDSIIGLFGKRRQGFGRPDGFTRLGNRELALTCEAALW